ncbi:MAG: outer membrane lipoprotein chaperone LolA [Gammaproteobacteria bacterium]|nr:outer membrane lipoprotein chaperone LolA [Gammaproteobacteria bacterium]
MSKHYKILIGKIFFILFFSFTANISFADTTAADELAKSLNSIHTMQANFEQSMVNSKGGNIGQKTLGSMKLERPGKFRWEITQPNNQLIIINKDKSFLYDIDLEQVVKRKMDYRKPGNPAMLLSSPVETLKQSFKITKLNNSKTGSWFKLTPKTQGNGYQWIKMHFITGQLRSMQITDDLEQQSTITFNNIVLNKSISSKMFVLTTPPNTEIFDAE